MRRVPSIPAASRAIAALAPTAFVRFNNREKSPRRDQGKESMSRQFVQQMADGDTIEEVYLVVDKQVRANRNGNMYLQIELRDRSGSISARLWNAAEPMVRSFETGDFLLVQGKVQLFQGALQMILSRLDRMETEKVELADFLPHTEKDISKLYERLGTLLRKMDNPHLRPWRNASSWIRNSCRVSVKRQPASAITMPISAACSNTSSR